MGYNSVESFSPRASSRSDRRTGIGPTIRASRSGKQTVGRQRAPVNAFERSAIPMPSEQPAVNWHGPVSARRPSRDLASRTEIPVRAGIPTPATLPRPAGFRRPQRRAAGEGVGQADDGSRWPGRRRSRRGDEQIPGRSSACPPAGFELGERAVPGAEVVDGDLDADLLAVRAAWSDACSVSRSSACSVISSVRYCPSSAHSSRIWATVVAKSRVISWAGETLTLIPRQRAANICRARS